MDFEKREQILKNRIKQIEKFESSLQKNLTSFERNIYSLLLDKIITELSQEDGFTKFNTKNVNLVNKASKIVDEIFSSNVKGLRKDYLKQIKEIQDSVLQQYGGFLSKDKAGDFFKKKNNTLSKALGVIDNKIQEGGFVHELFNLDPIKKELQQEVFKAVAGQSEVSQLKKNLKKIVITNSQNRGVLNKRIYNQIADSYTQIERAEAKFFAEELGMTAFIFFGTVINTTRPFCKSRANQVFLVSEAKLWKNISFVGKPVNYNPIVDLGGYNCRHTPKFITNAEALRRRSDLIVVKGSLRKK